MIFNPTQRIAQLESELLAVLREIAPTQAESLVSAISNLIDEKVEQAVDDMSDRIEKRGMYDPDY